MERKRKIGMLLLAVFLLAFGWLGIIDQSCLLKDLLDAWHWPSAIYDILTLFAFITLPLGASLLVYLLLSFINLRVKSVEISCIVFILFACYAPLRPLFERNHYPPSERCMVNQKEISSAFEMYALDNHDRLPEKWDSIKLDSDTFICPSTIRHFHQPGGYGVNAYLLGKNLNDIKDPTTKLLTMDAKQMTSLIHSPDDIALRHYGGFIAAFLDGHAELITDMGKVRLQLNEQPRKK